MESAKAQLTELQSQLEIVRASYNAALENPDASQEEIDILAAQVSALEEQEAAVSSRFRQVKRRLRVSGSSLQRQK